MNEKYSKFLPIGSVVLMKGANKRVMITGFCVSSKVSKTQMFDYIGCLYPEGIMDTEKNLLFNHDDIDKIFWIGYSDDEDKKFKESLNEALKQNSQNEG